MAGFTDTKGRHWELRITPHTMRAVQQFADVNLGTILHNNMTPLAELLGDLSQLCSVLWALCRDQAARDGVDLNEFMESVAGDTLEVAAEAFLEGVQDMYPTKATSGLRLARMVAKKQNPGRAIELLDKMSTGTATQSDLAELQELIQPTSPAENSRGC